MPSTSAILKSIQHPTRRRILTMLNESQAPVPYTNLLPLCDNSTGKLNYHLRMLDDIAVKADMGYILTEKGENILVWLGNIVSIADIPDKDKPVIIFSRIFPDKSYRDKYLLFLVIAMVISSIPLIFIDPMVLILVLIPGIISAGLIQKYYQSIWYQITDTEVIVHKGIITKTMKIVPYRTITNIELKRGLFDRGFKISTIEIQTAGFTRSGVEEKLVGLIDADDIIETIIERIRLLNPINVPGKQSSGEHLVEKKGLINIRNELKSLNKELKQ